jgi:hypothetical protein
MTRNLETVAVANTRDMRFGEILVIKEGGIDVYNTTGSNECPAELWDALDTEELAKELGAQAVRLNGPHYWMMDSQSLSLERRQLLEASKPATPGRRIPLSFRGDTRRTGSSLRRRPRR